MKFYQRNQQWFNVHTKTGKVNYSNKKMKLLKLLSEQRKTIIITLHDVNLVLQYCSKYVLLKSGQIFAQGNQEIINVKNMEHLFEVKMKQIKDEENFYIMPF